MNDYLNNEHLQEGSIVLNGTNLQLLCIVLAYIRKENATTKM